MTALATFVVNKNAEAKKPAERRLNKSPDVMTSSQLSQSTVTKTLRKIMASDQASPQYTTEASSDPLRITI